jgi:peroxiredoxin
MKRPLLTCLAILLACDRSTANAPADEPTPQAQAEAAKPERKTVQAASPADPAAPADESPAPARVGEQAPDFELTDLQGNTHKLSEHTGKTVVLEWFNPGCPFVVFAHDEGPLREMAKQERERGVVWLAINSGAPGKQGTGKETNQEAAHKWNMDHPLLLDESGSVGRLYGAEKTPHMFLIDEEGVLRYRGAIDNAPIGEVDAGAEVRNHLAVALEELRAGKPISTSETPAYGCTVKYDKAG